MAPSRTERCHLPSNTALTPCHRLKVAQLVVEEGWPISEVAARSQVSCPTVKRSLLLVGRPQRPPRFGWRRAHTRTSRPRPRNRPGAPHCSCAKRLPHEPLGPDEGRPEVEYPEQAQRVGRFFRTFPVAVPEVDGPNCHNRQIAWRQDIRGHRRAPAQHPEYGGGGDGGQSSTDPSSIHFAASFPRDQNCPKVPLGAASIGQGRLH